MTSPTHKWLNQPPPVPRPSAAKLVRWGWISAAASVLFPPLALAAIIFASIAIARDRARAGAAIIVCALACAAIGATIGYLLVEQQSNTAATDRRNLYESELQTALPNQVGTDVGDVTCIARSGADAHCLATLADGSTIGVTVQGDEQTGEWFWQVDP